MSRVNSLDDIDCIHVHWSESNYINDILGNDENCDIEKGVDANAFDSIIQKASKQVGSGYDKTSLTVTLKNGVVWANESKFYLTKQDSSLLNLLNKGE